VSYNSLLNPASVCASKETVDFFYNSGKNPEISARRDYFLSYFGLKVRKRKIGPVGF
jgi:hypothetical protein